ncbi:hypothetical protein [Myroides indicus]|uniref:Uncharacterized protein n=1 Tax=Myroides indicus TaxID=1323422 RepID=A0A4R7F118_9FLAO|nr:hypothetical protein [Myroides indicus]TDS63573.1 hypothetical protein C8P70_1063 [Myroides indicus]
MLFACSDEYVQETVDTLPTAYTNDPGIPYESPFLNGICCSLVNYHFINESDLDLEFVPYVGLARFDGVDDGNHFGWALTPVSNYPNVLANGMEYLSLIECLPVFTASYSSDFYTNLGQLPTSYALPNTVFHIANPSSNIYVEAGFLSEDGKFYSFEATVTDPVTGTPVINEHLKFPFLPKGVTDPNTLSGEWIPLPPSGMETEDLWYHHETLEICIGNDYINHPGGGVGWNDKPSIVEFSYNGKEYRLEAYTTSTDAVISLSIL